MFNFIAKRNMRILYFLFKIVLQYPLRIFYPRIKLVNAPKRFFGSTIYVCNHAASFMDPLIVGVLQRPIVFFMTRSDVFNKFLNPIYWAVQMLPIYREHDGVDTKAKNEQVFKKCTSILSYGRNLLIFGEGFTDDTFIRSLKPVKKGAVRIGFLTLESLNWNKKIYMAAVGINYGHPNYLGSDLVISNSNRICLNDYKEQYLENQAKTIAEITKIIEVLMQEQLTYVETKTWAVFHEHVCQLRRNGINPVDTDFSIPLKKRWENSRKLALWLNAQQLDKNVVPDLPTGQAGGRQEDLLLLKHDTEHYFKEQKRLKVSEKFLYELSTTGKLSTTPLLLKLILLSPFIIPGLIHFFVPYKLVKRFVEKSFRRSVFWSSVKMMLGTLAMTVWNIPIVWLLSHFVIHSGLIAFIYYLLCPLLGVITYEWFRLLKDFQDKKRLKKKKLENLLQTRKELLERIENLIPKD